MAEQGGGHDSDSEEEYYENPVDLIKEFGSHPLMERAQKALLSQLRETNNRLQVQILEKEEELKRHTLERESTGVQLYSLQQQLARVQISLENAHNEFNGIVDARLQEEEILQTTTKNNHEQMKLIDDHSKQEKKYSGELDSLRETLQQIEKYNEEVKSEISITRRATYKAEQSMQQLERHKESQDLFVDNLNKQVKALQEQVSLHEMQLVAQKKETVEANTVLQETVRELDLIASEKKQLMIRWKAALSGLSRRDEALAQATQTLTNAENAVHDYDVEIETVRREIQKEQARHETLVSLRDRLENELLWVEDNLTKIRVERDQLQERYSLLTKSLAQTDTDSKKLETVAKSLDTDSEALLQSLLLVTQQRQKMEDDVQHTYSTRSNVTKAVNNLLKEQGRLLKKVHGRENEGNEIENEIARTKVDRLNASALNDQLRDQHSSVLKELQEKEAMIGKYQLEIRQRNDEVEKKMYRVDRLNKKYEKMVESVGGEENLGPLENTIRNLNKEIQATHEDCKELERDWLKKQTELVAVASESEQLTEANNELQARVTILSQQQLRLSKDLRSLHTDVKVSTQTKIDLQKDIAKLNTLISSNHEQEGSLQNANYILEMECVEELKEAERDCVALQSSIAETRSSKASILDEIVDMERQALLWEKKIQLDKETREALDPTVGQQETQNMEKEIHRMSLRLEALKREEERLAGEMERSITKRATIASRYNSKSAASSSKSGPGGAATSLGKKSNEKDLQNLSQASVKKRIGVLKKDARVLAEETSRTTSLVEERKAQLSEMTSELERLTAQFGTTEELSNLLQAEINDLLYQKQLNQERVSYRQRFTKKLKELSTSCIDHSQSLLVERRLLSSTQTLDNVKEIISDLQDMCPHLVDVLQRVMTMADPALEISDVKDAQ